MKTCACDGWNVSTMTSSGEAGAALHLFKGFAPSGKTRKSEYYGRRFASTDAARAFALERGFVRPWCGRNSAFIHLRLSPRCRVEAKHILLCWGEKYALRFIAKLVDSSDYMTAALNADYMAETRARWVEYIRNPHIKSAA